MRSIYRITQTIRLALGLPEKHEEPQYSIIESGIFDDGFKCSSQMFHKWAESLYSKVNLQCFSTCIHDHLKRFLLQDDEVRLQVPEVEVHGEVEFHSRPDLFER